VTTLPPPDPDPGATAAAAAVRRDRPGGWLPELVIVLGVLATVLSLALVGRLAERYETGLEITVDAAEVTVEVAEQLATLPAELVAVAEGVADTLAQVSELTEVAATSTTDLAAALRTNVATSVAGTADIADRVASIVGTIENFIPGDTRSLAEELRDVADGLRPVPDQLVALADSLDAGAVSLEASLVTLAELEGGLRVIAEDIGATGSQVDELTAIAQRVATEAAAIQADARNDLWLLRLTILALGGVTVAIGFALRSFRQRLEA
jgi:ABC-type transporter Mla subunit MlaD